MDHASGRFHPSRRASSTLETVRGTPNARQARCSRCSLSTQPNPGKSSNRASDRFRNPGHHVSGMTDHGVQSQVATRRYKLSRGQRNLNPWTTILKRPRRFGNHLIRALIFTICCCTPARGQTLREVEFNLTIDYGMEIEDDIVTDVYPHGQAEQRGVQMWWEKTAMNVEGNRVVFTFDTTYFSTWDNPEVTETGYVTREISKPSCTPARGPILIRELSKEVDPLEDSPSARLAREQRKAENLADQGNSFFLQLKRLYNEKKYLDAAAECERMLGIHPDSGDITFNYAILLKKLKRYDEAKVQYKRALELAPKDPKYRFLYAYHLGDMELYEEAAGQYLKGLELEPDNSSARYRYARLLYEKLNLPDGALMEMKQLEEADYSNAAEWVRMLERELENPPTQQPLPSGNTDITKKGIKVEKNSRTYGNNGPGENTCCVIC